MSASGFHREAGEVCLYAHRRHIPVSAATIKWKVRYLEYEVALTRTEIDRLAELRPPPAKRALFADLVRDMRAENAIAAKAALRFAHGDVSAEPGSLKARYDLYQRERSAALNLDLANCP